MPVETEYNGTLRDDLYHCTFCDVVFHEAVPSWYDVTPCPACDWPAKNTCLDYIEIGESRPLDCEYDYE